jgi:uncharacterized membrane protein
MKKSQQHLLFLILFVVFNVIYTALHLDEGFPNAMAESLGAFVLFFMLTFLVLAMLNSVFRFVKPEQQQPQRSRIII